MYPHCDFIKFQYILVISVIQLWNYVWLMAMGNLQNVHVFPWRVVSLEIQFYIFGLQKPKAKEGVGIKGGKNKKFNFFPDG